MKRLLTLLIGIVVVRYWDAKTDSSNKQATIEYNNGMKHDARLNGASLTARRAKRKKPKPISPRPKSLAISPLSN